MNWESLNCDTNPLGKKIWSEYSLDILCVKTNDLKCFGFKIYSAKYCNWNSCVFHCYTKCRPLLKRATATSTGKLY